MDYGPNPVPPNVKSRPNAGCYAAVYIMLAIGVGLFVWGAVEIIQLIGRLG